MIQPTTEGVQLIAAERRRQIAQEGHTLAHDRHHQDESLALAACSYAIPRSWRRWKMSRDHNGAVPVTWPWEFSDWRPTQDSRIRELTKAGALIAAEMDRLLEDRTLQIQQPVIAIGEDVSATGDFGQLICPMPDCTEQLYLEHTAIVPLRADTTVEHAQPRHAVSTGWKVECCAGHVLLLPPAHHVETAEFTSDCAMCNDSDQIKDEVPRHDDIARLRAVLAALSGAGQ